MWAKCIAVATLLFSCNSDGFRGDRNPFAHAKRSICMSVDTYCPDTTFSHTSLGQLDAISGLQDEYPPVIYYIRSNKAYDSLVDLIHDETNLKRSYIKDLVALGSVYRHDSQNDRFQRLTSMKDCKAVRAGDQCRVFATPRRFKDAHDINWQQTVLATSLMQSHIGKISMAVVDKAPGIPITATTNNGVENVLYKMQMLLKGHKVSDHELIDRIPQLQPKKKSSNRDRGTQYEKHRVHEKPSIEELAEQSTQIHVVSRLDTCTAGLSPLAIGDQSAKTLHRLVAEKVIKKKYRLLCMRAIPSSHVDFDVKDEVEEISKLSLPLGVVRHCFKRANKGGSQKPSLLREYDPSLLNMGAEHKVDKSVGSVWQMAELIVERCTPVKYTDLSPSVKALVRETERDMSIQDSRQLAYGGLGEGSGIPLARSEYEETETFADRLYECEVELVTGRTHQIRLQFAALGFPLVGDTRYAPAAGLLDESHIDVSAQHGHGDGKLLFGQDPLKITLQCCELTFPFPATTFKLFTFQEEQPRIGNDDCHADNDEDGRLFLRAALEGDEATRYRLDSAWWHHTDADE